MPKFRKIDRTIDKAERLKSIDEIKRKNDEENKLVPKFRKIDRKIDKAQDFKHQMKTCRNQTLETARTILG